jgi:hypothetical protein
MGDTAPRVSVGQPSGDERRDVPSPLEPDPEWLFGVGTLRECGFIDVRGREVVARQFRVHRCFDAGFSRREGFPAEVDRRFGFIDGTGRLAVPARFDAASEFRGGRAAVTAGGRAGFLDAQGRAVIPLNNDAVSTFSEGLAAVRPGGGGRWGYVDTTGRMVIPARFRSADDFDGGLALVATDAGLVSIDRRGAEVARLAGGWEWSSSRSDGMLKVFRLRECGYLDIRNGRLVIPPRFPDKECISPESGFSEGLAALPDPAADAGRRIGFIDKVGRFAIPPRFQGAGSFRGGLAPAATGNAWGFIDRAGRFVIAPRFKHAKPFAHGLAFVLTAEGEPGYIDSKGHQVWPPKKGHPDGRAIPFKTLLLSTHGGTKRRMTLLTDRASFVRAWSSMSYDRTRPPPRTNFAAFDYVLVSEGHRPSTSYGIEVRQVALGPRGVTVYFDEYEPILPDGGQFSITTDAAHLVEIPKQRLPYAFVGRLMDTSGRRGPPP